MKYGLWIALTGFSYSTCALAQEEPQIIERGPHHRVIQRIVTERQPDGTTVERISRYQEIASGLCYQNDLGVWTEAREEVEIFQGAAVARQGQHRVTFAANLNSPGAIDLLTPDGKRFRSTILGLAYTDGSGRSVLIAELKDCAGAVLPPNQVIYSSALQGDCLADVRYTYTKSAFEQDIILITAPPSPAEWNLNPETTRLEVLTEFIEIPEGTMTPVVLKQENDPVARQQSVEPDLIDHRLDFGVMKFEQGYAFPLAQGDPFGTQSVPTGKSIERIEGRVFLIEKVDYADIREYLQELPPQAAANPRRKAMDPANGRRQFAGFLPPAPKGERGAWKEKQFAKIEPNRKGLLIDYITLIGSLTNLTLRLDTTYYVNTNNTVNLYGNTVIEPTCVKFGPGTTRLQILGSTECRTDPGRPAFFVSKDDNSIGEILPNSTGSPGTNRYALAAVHLATSGTSHSLAHLRFRNAVRALWVTTGTATFTLEHSQFGFTDYPIYSQNSGLSPVRGRNLLVHDGLAAFRGDANSSNWLEHLTVHRVKTFNAGGAVFLTNSLVISTTNALTFTGSPNITNLDDTGFFQIVGASSHYLINGSTNRNSGTTNINPDLLAALKKKTTHPPVVISTNITGNTTLAVQAQRDTDTPDLGAHFDPLDFVVSQVAVTNATLTLETGTALGIYGSSSAPGLLLLDGGKILSTGAPDNLNRIVRYNLVQEQATTNWSASSVGRSITTVSPYGTNLLASEASFRFTDFSMPANGNDHLYVGATNLTFTVQDSQFHGGSFTAVQPDVTLLNNLFDRVAFKLYANVWPFAALVRNGTFFGGTVTLSNAVSGGWNFRDNLFDTTNLLQVGFVTNNYNAYLTNSVRLTNNGANDVLLTLTNIAYELGPLGRFYLPTNLTSHSVLFDSGSQNAANAGLYHYTVVTNQTRELTSTVDLGFHSVAVNSSGQPHDTDGDGLADYLEDTNGNGLSDGSENSYVNPVLNIASPLDYIKGGPAKRLDTNGVAYDSDSVNFNGGQLTVTITSGAEANDLLAIRNQGTGANQIGATTNAVSYEGTTIASYTGGSSTNALVISFNASALNTSVQALVRNLTFQSISNEPANSNRILNFTLTDGRGGTNAPVSQTINFVCPAAIDAMIVIDISQSLEPAEFEDAKLAASNFVNHLSLTTDRVGLISFAGYANFDSPLTNNGALVQSKILSLIDTNGTRFQPSLDMARSNLTSTASNILPLIVLLSDGQSGGPGDFYTNRVLATNAALAVKDAGIRIISIAYGNEGGTNGGTNFMKWFASSPNDFYYHPSASEIGSNFTAIADGICRGFSLVAITNPPDSGTIFVAPSSITLGAEASDSEGISKVEFYNFGTNKLGEDASSPYSIDWSSPSVGTNKLTARAIDNLGISTTSTVVTVIVHSPPSIQIVAPTNATAFAAVVNLLVRASAVDVDGWITNVQFFTNDVASVNVTNPPFQFPWTNLTNHGANYRVHAIAKDNHGNPATSAQVTFNVEDCPQVGLKSFLLSTNTVVGGSAVTGTVILSNAAPAGGQLVTLQCNDPNVSIPASVFVAADGTSNTFRIDTYAVATGGSVSITAVTALKSVSTNLTISEAGFQTTRFVGQCGPMDVAFVVDQSRFSWTGQGITENFEDGTNLPPAVITAFSNAVKSIKFASDGDYRLGLVTFASNNVYCHVQFSLTNGDSFLGAISTLGVSEETPFNQPFCVNDPSLEALNTAINNLSSAGRTNQQGDFTNLFRLEARKIVVLLTEAGPLGFGTNFFHNEDKIYDVAGAHQRAVEAALKGIQICPIVLPANTSSDDPEYFPAPFEAAEDYAFTTGGKVFVAKVSPGLMDPAGPTPPVEPAPLNVCLENAMALCGADLGEVVTTRDDLWQWNHAAINLNNSRLQTASLNPATFDLSGIDGSVVAAQFQRTGHLRVNHGSHFDLDLGVASVTDANLAFFARPRVSAQSNALAVAYTTNWNLPFPFFADIRQQLGSIYSVDLLDRASTVCGNNFDVTDTPQSDWPAARNTLTFKTLSGFEIAQGRCRDLVLAGTNAPVNCDWDILLFDSVIARSCAPSGWSVEPDYSAYGGYNVTVPTNALTVRQYEVRVRVGETEGRSARFDVVPAGAQRTAPVLLPLTLTPSISQPNYPVSLTVALDAPVTGDGVFVSLSTSNLPAGLIPSYAHIQGGQSSTVLDFNVPSASSNFTFEIVASFNGRRKVVGAAIGGSGSPGDGPTVTAVASEQRVDVSWEAHPDALSYTVWREKFSGSYELVLIETNYTGTCLIDTSVTPDETYCYKVTALTPWGLSGELDDCGTPTSVVLRPRITPHGGRFNDFAAVTITCETTNATIYYTLDGSTPTTNSFHYTNGIPLRLTNSAQLIAVAINSVGESSIDDRADFHISEPAPLPCSCGLVGSPPGECSTNAMLTATSEPSAGYNSYHAFGSRFSFGALQGDFVVISMSTLDFNPHLFLFDPAGNVVAESLDAFYAYNTFIFYTLKTNGTFVIEATSQVIGQTGDFTLSFHCQHAPKLDVYFGTNYLTNGATIDFGISSNGTPTQQSLTISNTGSAILFVTNLINPSALFSNNPASYLQITNGLSTNLVVTFNAASNGPWTGVLTLQHNEPENFFEPDNPFVLYLEAFANPPGHPPTATITSPSNNQLVTMLPPVTISATTTSTNTASVTQVVFRAKGPPGTVPIGAGTSNGVNSWSINWSNAPGGVYQLTALATDSDGRAAFSTAITVTNNNRPVAVNDRVSVSKNDDWTELNLLGNDTDADGHTIAVTNIVVGATNGTASFSGGVVSYKPEANVSGHDYLTYAIFDVHGAKATGAVSVAIFPPFDQITDPVAILTNPASGSEISGAIGIGGTASSEFMGFWELQYRRRTTRPTPWTTLAGGNESVVNGTLGTFDPTGLPNGIYEIRLRVVDVIAVAVETRINIRIGESPKIGHFTLAFTDLQIPVSGLPITLTRTYDSRNTDQGDFGAGWNLDVSSVRLEKSGIMGEGWQAVVGSGFNGFQTCVYETEPHLITITFPDDKVFRFVPVLALNGFGNNCAGSGYLGHGNGIMTYSPLPGTVGTLREVGSNALLKVGFIDTNSPVTFHDARENYEEIGNTNFFGPVYDPREFEFTTLDGRKFHFNEAGKITLMIDRNGNSLEFTANGIVHTSGKSVKFVRDAAGRITEVYDPNGLNSSNQPSGPAALQFKYDGSGNLLSVHRLTTRNATNPAYVTTQFGYENTRYPHYLTSITDPRGVTGIRNEYADDGKLKSLTDASGKTINYIHDLSNRTEIVVDRLGNTNVFKYDAKGNVTNSVNALGHTNTYAFDANNNKTREVIADVLTNTFAFDANNLLTENVVGGLITNKFTYSKFGQVLAALDGLGRGTTNFYDSLGNLLVTTNALGFTNGFTYDASGNLLTSRDALGTLVANWYDQFGNLTNSVTSKGSLSTTNAYTHDANGNHVTERTWRTLPNGQMQELLTTLLYDAQNRVIASVDTLGRTNGTVFNEIGKQEAVIDKLGHTNQYEYEERGQLVRVTHPDGTSESYAYDAEGRRTNSVDRAGRVTSFVFDALGRLTQTIYPDNTMTTTSYDAAGRVVWTVDARGFTNWFAYDAAGRRIATTNALGQVTQSQYDQAGNLIVAVDALNRTTTYQYDALNRRTKTIFPDGTTQTTLYDELGRRVGEVDQAGVTNRFGYDGLGRLVAVTNGWATPSATWATYAYDENGNQTNQVDALGRKTIFQFDSLGRRVARILPGGQIEDFAYDDGGNLLRHTNFNGQIITNNYDVMNRLLGRWHGSTNLENHAYSVTGQRASMSNESGILTFTYDKRDRLITNTTPAGTLIYAYDQNGNLTNMLSSTANGVSIGYQYDVLNRLKTVTDNRLGLATKNTDYTFDAVGNLTAVKYPNGVTNEWQYDKLNRLTNEIWKLNATPLASFLYTLGLSGNRTSLSEAINGTTRTFAWSYDSLYRLTDETISGAAPTGMLSYKLDAVGNRTNRTSSVSGILTTNNYFDVNDWLDADSTTSNGSAWFDKNGNTRTNGATTYLYDWANRLTNSTTVTSIAYDANGNRVKKVVGGGTRLFLVSTVNPSGYAQVVEELTVSGSTTNLACAYVYGLDLISQRQSGITTNFYGYDGLGSVRFLLNLAGGLAATNTFDAWGSLIASTGSITNLYLFAGEQFDFDLKQYYNRARTWDPNTGRFVTRDTHEGNSYDPLSLHKYLFGADDPVNRIDPSGHDGTLISTLVMAAVVSTVAVISYSYVAGAAQDRSMEQVPDPNSDSLTADQNSVLIVNSKRSVDEIFQRLLQLKADRSVAVPTGQVPVSGVGGVIQWKLQGLYADAQAPFNVSVKRFVNKVGQEGPTDHLFSVVTMGGHPLAGYRFWRVYRISGNSIVVETGGVDEAVRVGGLLNRAAGFRLGQSMVWQLWQGMMEDALDYSGGDQGSGPYDNIEGGYANGREQEFWNLAR